MAFVKLDCGILNSTIWFDREAREVFLTALLMALPKDIEEPMPEIATRSLDHTGWVVPPGRYGFVEAASSGIIRRSGVEAEDGMKALERLAAPEESSRTPEFGGRRLIRVDGGYVVLNFWKYREKDHTAAARSRRYREKKRHTVSSQNHTVASRNVTQAEADAEHPPTPSKRGRRKSAEVTSGKAPGDGGPQRTGHPLDDKPFAQWTDADAEAYLAVYPEHRTKLLKALDDARLGTAPR